MHVALDIEGACLTLISLRSRLIMESM